MRSLWGYVFAAYGAAGALYGGYLLLLRGQARGLARELDGGRRGRAR